MIELRDSPFIYLGFESTGSKQKRASLLTSNDANTWKQVKYLPQFDKYSKFDLQDFDGHYLLTCDTDLFITDDFINFNKVNLNVDNVSYLHFFIDFDLSKRLVVHKQTTNQFEIYVFDVDDNFQLSNPKIVNIPSNKFEIVMFALIDNKYVFIKSNGSIYVCEDLTGNYASYQSEFDDDYFYPIIFQTNNNFTLLLNDYQNGYIQTDKFVNDKLDIKGWKLVDSTKAGIRPHSGNLIFNGEIPEQIEYFQPIETNTSLGTKVI